MHFSISAYPPFRFDSVVGSHGWFQLQPFQYDQAGGVLSYPLRLSGGRVVDLHISAISNGLQVECESITPQEKAEALAVLKWMFATELDLQPFYTAIRHEPALAHVEQRGMGRVLRSPTLFEDVIRTILTTNTLWAATRRMCANLVAQFGQPVAGSLKRKAFPTAERLADSSESQLRGETRLGYRAPYILKNAREVASGRLDLEGLKHSSLSTVELRKELLKLPGIGPYAAANLLILLGRSDYIPVDSWALKVVSHEWHNDQPVNAAQVQADLEKWGVWKGLVYFCWDWSKQYKLE